MSDIKRTEPSPMVKFAPPECSLEKPCELPLRLPNVSNVLPTSKAGKQASPSGIPAQVDLPTSPVRSPINNVLLKPSVTCSMPRKLL